MAEPEKKAPEPEKQAAPATEEKAAEPEVQQMQVQFSPEAFDAIKANFDKISKDKKKITREDMEKAFLAAEKELGLVSKMWAKEQRDATFKAMDLDGDGFISLDEFVYETARKIAEAEAQKAQAQVQVQLTENEFNILKANFEKISKDKKKISREDMEKAFLATYEANGLESTKAQRDATFNAMDLDGDGFIDLDEFVYDAALRIQHAEEEAMARQRSRVQVQFTREEFMALRANFERIAKDKHKITREDMEKAFLETAEKLKIESTKEQRDATFNAMDLDGDGYIDFDELVYDAALRKAAAQAQAQQQPEDVGINVNFSQEAFNEIKGNFEKIAKDKRKITREDMEKAFLQTFKDSGVETSKEQRDAIFKAMDLDGDGFIDLDEFVYDAALRIAQGEALRRAEAARQEEADAAQEMDVQFSQAAFDAIKIQFVQIAKDGKKITREDMEKAFLQTYKEMGLESTKAQRDATFNAMDLDGDGVIDLDEFVYDAALRIAHAQAEQMDEEEENAAPAPEQEERKEAEPEKAAEKAADLKTVAVSDTV